MENTAKNNTMQEPEWIDGGTDAVDILEWAERRNCENDFPVGTKFYTASPQRKPLTDEQYFEIGQRHGLPSYKVEQIHKELEEAMAQPAHSPCAAASNIKE